FLRTLWSCLNPGDLLLLGYDLKKDINRLLQAYDDRHGITRAFNFNLLERINRELKANFNRSDFEHYATYNPRSSAMESFLISLKRQEVQIGAVNRIFQFEAYEP